MAHPRKPPSARARGLRIVPHPVPSPREPMPPSREVVPSAPGKSDGNIAETDGSGKLPDPLTTLVADGKPSDMSANLGPLELSPEGELVMIGTDIMKLGSELKQARVAAEEAVALVRRLEAELQPKIIRHAELIRAAAGVAFAAPAVKPSFPVLGAAPAAPLPDWAPPIARAEAAEDPFVGSEVQVTAAGVAEANGLSSSLVATPGQVRPTSMVSPTTQMKARVKQFLKTRKSDEGISAMDIAEVLKIDAGVVREAMRELKTGR